MTQRILVCDDEELIRWSLTEHLRGLGFSVETATNGEEALAKFEQAPHDLVLTDLRMPTMSGLELLRAIRAQGYNVPVLILTAHGEVDTAVEATRLGAAKYLSKPFDLVEVAKAISSALECFEVKPTETIPTRAYGDLVGQAPSMLALFETLTRLEQVEAPTVLLTGESGTGKDVVANSIHKRGTRQQGPLMQVDCASLPENLVESELFGHERGAFTDARSQKRGIFEEAKHGTIFLDEIGEMNLVVQAKLLRALENRSFRRVGGTRFLDFNAGVIAATNRDLKDAVSEGKFRQDLFFRLKVIQITVPPLRERREDVPLLIDHFVQRFNREYRKQIRNVSGDAMRKLSEYNWPGNVRELRNVIERIMILEAETAIGLEHLPSEIRYGESLPPSQDAESYVLPPEGINLKALEQSLLIQAMLRTNQNQSAAARLLGISRYALRYRLNKHQLL